jgi:hypothetical protein
MVDAAAGPERKRQAAWVAWPRSSRLPILRQNSRDVLPRSIPVSLRTPSSTERLLDRNVRNAVVKVTERLCAKHDISETME